MTNLLAKNTEAGLGNSDGLTKPAAVMAALQAETVMRRLKRYSSTVWLVSCCR